jgi:phospholipid/cholesterol/gamma-HCH transport system ATP-binding protein
MSTAASPSQSVRVEARGLRKSFGDHEVLRGVSFTVERGEIFVLMGPSGSGKSVLLKHMIGLEEADSGELLIEGQSVHTEGLRDRYRMAMVFQSGALLNSLTVGENVGLYLREHRLKPEADIRRIIAEKLDIVGLKGTEEKIPGELSGGMKKRVALARALVIDPQLILYDEPTSELDPLIAITIGQEILALRDRTHATSIVVTHDRDLAFGIADRIAMIADGEILALGRPEEVRRSPHPLVQKFLTADFKPKPQ